MRRWQVTFTLIDDGIDDEEGEIRGNYFTARELKKEVTRLQTAGLTIKNIRIIREDN